MIKRALKAEFLCCFKNMLLLGCITLGGWIFGTVMSIIITFLDREMADSFADALIAKGYCPYDIELCSASVAFTFGIPHSFQPRCKRPFVTHMAQRVNRIYCRIFNKITRPFADCYEQILYLYFYLPFAFRRLMRIKRHKTQKFHRCRR